MEPRILLSLVINPTFAANITSDPNAAAIEATINRTIAAYQSLISDNVTVDITFQEGGGLGGSSGGLVYFEKYKDYYDALVSHKTSSNDTTAIASLPNQANDPINNQDRIVVRSPLARALGFSAPSAGGTAGDGTITLNTAICNLDRTTAQDSTHYDLQAVTAHEIDEILGFGSALDAANNGAAVPTGRIKTDDLFRYDQNGARSFSTTATDQAYFSIDGGTTDLARFNQTHTTANAGDYGDWYSFFGGQTPQVQDAFNTPGATANLGAELTRLDVLGYTLNPLNTPLLTAAASQTAVEGTSKAIDLGSFSDPDAAPWGVTVSWGDGSANTSFFVNTAGSLGTQTHTYAEEGSYAVAVTVNDFTNQAGTKSFNVNVSDPAVIASSAVVNAVEGTDSGSQTVATFTDPGGAESVSNYSAVIDWGDGTATPGTITFSGGSYAVQGNHTYAEESAADHTGSNPYAITATISHGAAPDAVVHSTGVVTDPAVNATGAFVINGSEGSNSGDQTVATFTDRAGEPLGDYSATILWGDGTSPIAGAITFASGTFTVVGNHTYAEESAADHAGSNPYSITVTIHHEAAPDAIVTSSAVVSDPAVTPSGGFAFAAVEGAPSAAQTVATFTDPGGAEALSDYSALIDWGDGTAASPGAIALSSGVYTIQGSHTFTAGLGLPDDFGNTLCDANTPSYHKPITVTISHEAAPVATAVSDATIKLTPASAHLAGGNLLVVGTTGNDQFQITPVGNTGAVNVQLNSRFLGAFTLAPGGRIIVAAMAGDDDIQIAGGVRLNTVLYGGPGNDRIKGGGGQNIEVGCDGNDDLTGGNQQDLLIGGTGSDRLNGGQGGDILIAGINVDASLAEDDKYSHLLNIFNRGPVIALDDGAQDILQGAAGSDTLYYHFLGSGITDIVHGQIGTRFNI